MAIERTLSIIKPDAVQKQATGHIVQHLIDAGLHPVAMKMMHMAPEVARGFYHVHRERPFFKPLTEFMSSGPVLVMVLEGEGAIARNREAMGATDSKKAAAGTIRSRFGTDIERNAVHGSDGPDTARWEISYFFAGAELL